MVRAGSPVIDARGALVGRVEYVGLACPATRGRADERAGFVTIRGTAPSVGSFLIDPEQIAYVTDDHVRLSIVADVLTQCDGPL
jgi:hypothetical protein